MTALPPLVTRDCVIDTVRVVFCGIGQAAAATLAAFATCDREHVSGAARACISVEVTWNGADSMRAFVDGRCFPAQRSVCGACHEEPMPC